MGDGHNPLEEFLSRRGRAPTILIVEDEELIRATLSEHLQDCGFEVFEAANAAAAVELLKSEKADIDLVFSDIMMPGEMNGLGLAAWLRIHRSGLPILLTSGQAHKVQAVRELCEAEPFLIKPYKFQPLARDFMKLIETRNK